jgi:serine/threonine protein kinase
MRDTTDHLNIIKLHETFEGEGTYYFVMDIVEGQSLYDQIKKHAQKAFDDDQIKLITR